MRRYIVLVIALAVMGFAYLTARDNYRRAYPDRAFEQSTGQALPSGIQATKYAWAINDNFLHVAHYWVLTGSERQLNQFALNAGLGESTEDATWTLPDTQSLVGIPLRREDLVRGYEGDQPRNNWLWVFPGGNTALYEFN